ncbi:FRIGIDA-like protein 5 isoform X2 [Humulus lupulus]|uniref:FRIGIDA-like protein 5 isoform X2 n=1 Tax=Humulus lupulus TaxID=3486 RepID=UPI002B40CD33|nr:FRIGIDA-like protein 5 isoform X2 [Humulus lupulus]
MEQSFFKNQSASLQKSSETRLKELEMKETHINNRFKEIESKENEIGLVLKMLEQRERMVELKEKGLGGISDFDRSLSMDGQKMLMFLNQYVDEQEKLHDVIYNDLKRSDDPAKLVLDAVKEFYAENEEMGFSGSVRKRSCVILLEQLTRLGPVIEPAVKAEVATLAREWRAKIKMENEQNGVLEVMGFLLLLGAYGLVDEFDIFEMLSVFETIGQQHGQAGEPCTTVDLANKDPVSTVFDSQVKANWSLEEDKELDNRIALSFDCPSDALKYFCVGMDGRSLRSFLYDHVEEHDSLCNEVQCALTQAPDPAKLVLDAIPGFLRTQPEFDKGLALAKIRKSCILLLEQLMIISPQVSPNVREEASAMADEWAANLGQKFQRPVTVYGFLLFLAAYGFNSDYKADELIRLFGIATQYQPSPGLCQVLGLADKVEVIIQSLIQKPLLLEAIDNMYAYQVADKFQPVRILKGYLSYSKKRIYKKGKGKKPVTQQNQGIDKEITAMRTVIKYIVKYNLESEFPPEDLKKQIVKLEQQKGILGTLPTEKPKAYGSASTSADSQVKFEPAPNENLQLDNQRTSLSTGPWPQLDAFCISNAGKGLDFFSYEHTEEYDSMSSSSSHPWPELKSFCVNMEGRGLRNFLHDHIEEHDSLCNEVYDALQYAADPAKLVLDAMPGFFRSQSKSVKGLSLNKVRKSCILLLEQLITILPEINPQVKEESLKMANEWKANLGEKYQKPVIVYGFLHFVAAYELASNYEGDELLGLMTIANQYKVCLNLCQILGLTDRIEVLIKTLLQKNLIFEAIEHIYAFEMSDKFKPAARLLKGYLIFIKKTAYKKGTRKQAIDKEIAAVRNVMKCIAKYKLESEYPLEELERQIVELENQKLMLL